MSKIVNNAFCALIVQNALLFLFKNIHFVGNGFKKKLQIAAVNFFEK